MKQYRYFYSLNGNIKYFVHDGCGWRGETDDKDKATVITTTSYFYARIVRNRIENYLLSESRLVDVQIEEVQ